MSRGVNKAILIGSLGAEPETRYSQSGTAMTSIRIATNEEWKDKQTGEKQSRTEWHRIKFFGKLAEIASEYLHKGSQVYVEGSIRTDKYTDKEGIERYSTDIIANEMQMLGSKPEGQRQQSQPAGNGRAYQKIGKPAGNSGIAGEFEDASGGFVDDSEIPLQQLGKRKHWVA